MWTEANAAWSGVTSTNAGNEPVTRYLVRIAGGTVSWRDRAVQPAITHRDHPLTWVPSSTCGPTAASGEMDWRAKLDRDALKEIWLLFENDEARFPLYPGQRATIEYAYTVGEDKWGHWFQRAVRLPTRRLSMQLDFPSELSHVVWGVETSMTAEAGPLKTPVTEGREDGRTVFEWSTEDPPLNARFRLEWRIPQWTTEGRPYHPATSVGRTAAERTDEERLASCSGRADARPGRPLVDLPEQAALASDIVARLLDALHLVGEYTSSPRGWDWPRAVGHRLGGHSDEGTTDPRSGRGPIVLLKPTGGRRIGSTAMSSTKGVCPFSTYGVWCRVTC